MPASIIGAWCSKNRIMGGNKLSIFQIVIIGIFGALFVGAIIVFASIRASNARLTTQPVTLWGPLPNEFVGEVIADMHRIYPELKHLTYTEVDPRYYYGYITEALATGRGPDLFLVEHDLVWSQRQKMFTIPYEYYPERNYKETFIDVASVFQFGGGIMALPFINDPLVLYYNTEHFANAAIAVPPKYWDEMYGLVEKLAKVEDDTTVTKSALAFGEYSNVTNAKGIISALLMQAGNPVVRFDPSGALRSALSDTNSSKAVSAVRFYTEFANPTRRAYNWNRSLKTSREMFLSGTLSMYVGYASELKQLREINPNLPIGFTLLPQARTTGTRSTYAKVWGIAAAKASTNVAAALYDAQILTSKDFVSAVSAASGMPPLRRDLLSERQTAAFPSITFESSIISKTWLDPYPYGTDRMFDRMIDNITSGKRTVESAVTDAGTELGQILE